MTRSTYPLAQGLPLERFPGESLIPPDRDLQSTVAQRPVSEELEPTSSATPPEPRDARSVFRGFNRSIVGKVVTSAKMDPRSLEQYRRLAAALHQVHVQRGIER